MDRDREQRPPVARRWRDAAWQIALADGIVAARGATPRRDPAAQRLRVHAVRVTVQALAASTR
ncbi:hypothetical protein WME94_22420 [Sorangium sp. So ce429]